MSKPNYTLRRIVAAVIVIVAFWGTLTIGVKIALQPRYECTPALHVVQPGESVWSIAQTYCDGTIGDVVYDLTEIYGTTVHPGEVIIIK